MTIQEAIQNIDIVISNVQMKRGEHVALQQSVALVVKRCEDADKLEKEKSEDKD